MENWPRHREVLSRAGNAYVRLALGLHLGDATAGYRAYRASALRAVDLASVESHGYCFQVDMAWRVVRAGAWRRRCRSRSSSARRGGRR